MHFSVPNFPPPPAPASQADVQTVTRGDVLWNRPIFKAPPLELNPKLFEELNFAEDLRRIGLTAH